jgi:hypothetical protein
MAKKTQIVLIDDIDGGEAGDTVTFGIDGHVYEIDLSLEHEKELREGIAKFVGAATRLGNWSLRSGRRGAEHASRRSPVGVNRERNKAIRDWAEQQGIEVSPRGRIAQDVVDKFDQAHAG